MAIWLVSPTEVAATLKRKFARLYLDPAVVRRIKRVAIELGCQPHDLFVEAIDL